MNVKNGQFFSGTSGLVLPVANKQGFPLAFRDKSRLAYYASLFNSLEVNSSFYKVPMAATVKRWALNVPGDFRFTFKLFKEITHNKGLFFDSLLVCRFLQVIDQAGDKKGALLVQLPPGLAYNIAQLEKLLICIQQYNQKRAWQVSVEFRHPSWYRQKTCQLLQCHQAAMVMHDMPASATPPTTPWVDFIYLRFHGPAGDYKGRYTDDTLRHYAGMINKWVAEGRTVYTYFNNTIGDAVSNLATINGYIKTMR